MGLAESLRSDTVSALTLHKPVTLGPGATIAQAAEALRDETVGAVIIVDEQGQAAGMFTEKLLIRLLAHRPQAMGEAVAAHMSARVECLTLDAPIARLITTMQEQALRWVCVVDEQGRPTALADLRAVIEYVVEHLPRLIKAQPIESRLSIRQREGA